MLSRIQVLLITMNLKAITFAGLLYLFPTEMTYANPTPIEDELKDLAELVMKCGKKVSFEDYGSQNSVSGRYHMNSYSLEVPDNVDRNLGLPFPETVFFNFKDESIPKAPNQVVDKSDSFEITGKEVGYFSCHYQHKGDFQGHGCGADRFTYDLLEQRIRKAIEFIKKNVSPNCYGNRV